MLWITDRLWSVYEFNNTSFNFLCQVRGNHGLTACTLKTISSCVGTARAVQSVIMRNAIWLECHRGGLLSTLTSAVRWFTTCCVRDWYDLLVISKVFDFVRIHSLFSNRVNTKCTFYFVVQRTVSFKRVCVFLFSKSLGSLCSPQQTSMGKTCCSATLQPHLSKLEMKTISNGWADTMTYWELWTAQSQVWISASSSNNEKCSIFFLTYIVLKSVYPLCVCVLYRCPLSTSMVCPV